MLLKECENCKYLLKAIGIGGGVRCIHQKNNKKENTVISISYVVDCKLYESKNCNTQVQGK